MSDHEFTKAELRDGETPDDYSHAQRNAEQLRIARRELVKAGEREE